MLHRQSKNLGEHTDTGEGQRSRYREPKSGGTQSEAEVTGGVVSSTETGRDSHTNGNFGGSVTEKRKRVKGQFSISEDAAQPAPADGRKIWVRADHNTLGWEKILAHEDFHSRVQRDAALLADTKARLAADYGEAELRAIAEDYVQAYGFTDMSMEEVLEEVLSDYYAGIDVFAGTEDAQADLGKRGELVRDVTRERGDMAAAQGNKESTIRFLMFRGVSREQNLAGKPEKL